MPLHPQIKTLLEQLAALKMAPVSELTPAQARANYERLARLKPPSQVEIAGNRDYSATGPGGPLALRVYTPAGDAPGPWPMLMYFHGGGFVIGDLDSHNLVCRELCAGAECIVIAVDYRLAPEHKYPAAPEDCLAATRWAAEHAGELGGDASRLVVGGDSAGGNLATVTALRIRDEGGPALCGQLLVYPVTDHYSADFASYHENGVGYGLTRDSMIWYADHYMNSDADIGDPYATPLRAESLQDLPPAWLCTAEYDPLRDEGEAYAGRLRDEGVTTVFTRYKGAIHGIYNYSTMLEPGRRMMDDSCAWLRQLFDRRPE